MAKAHRTPPFGPGGGSPRIDVLLPVRNARRTLPSALGDVLGQRGVAVRVLAVVDTGPAGRDDGSLAWLTAAARREPRLLVIRGPGRGAGAALDAGLAAVETPLFSHIEADDRCPPDRLQRLHAALTGGALAAVTSRTGQFGSRTPGMRRYLDWQNALLEHAAMARERFVEIPAMHQSGLYRTDAVRAIGGYAPRGEWPADIDFWMRWFEHDALRAPLPTGKVPRVLYRWRQHAGQVTRSRERSGSAHSLDALRACKAHYLARLHGPKGARPRSVMLVSTGTTLGRWEQALVGAGFRDVSTAAWTAGRAVPAAAPGTLLVAAYGMPSVRAGLAAELGDREPRTGLLFVA
jgi:glycosyltransferase involved in cell wall biosynthesis